MTNLEIIKELKESTFIDEDGDSYKLEFQNPLTNKEIEDLKLKFPHNTIPEELLDILKFTKGWDGYGAEMVYFDSISEFGFTGLFPQSISLGTDGFGNYWILDLLQNGQLGKVFFVCHDPAVMVLNAYNLNEHLSNLLDFYNDLIDSALISMDHSTVFRILKNNDNTLPKSEFSKLYPQYIEYLDQFEGDDWTVADLRDATNNDGFPWGKFGPRLEITRHPKELLWILKNKKKGILSRLFGG